MWMLGYDRFLRFQSQESMKKFSFVLLIAALANLPIARAADIIGTVSLNGTPPPEVPYTPLMNDPTCSAMYTSTPTTHFYVVGPNHEVADAIVSLKPGR